MPIIKAAIKHLRQSQRRRQINNVIKNRLKKTIKEMTRLANQKKMDEFTKRLPEAVSIIDKAAKKNLIHKKNASRKKSSLAHLLGPVHIL